MYLTYYAHLFGIKELTEEIKLFGTGKIFWTSQFMATVASIKQMTLHEGTPESPHALFNTP